MTEDLPVGVGRVPEWWMEITPHHTLDEEDAEVRRAAEDQMAFYYLQVAALDDAGMLDANGNPKSDVDWSSWSPQTLWKGRANKPGCGAGHHESRGRNFQAGQAVVDPKLFGILESDPDFHAYLTGAKLPPGYFETMGEFSRCDEGGTQGILNNLKQTDYGRYGRQAETPSFKPAWAKKKLRSTTAGASIRQGQYDDSPNKHTNRRRVVDTQGDLAAPSVHIEGRHPSMDVQGDLLVDNLGGEHNPSPQEHSESVSPSLSTKPPQAKPATSFRAPVNPAPTPKPGNMTRTVRTIVRDGDEAPSEQEKTLNHADYMNQPAPVMSDQERKLQEQREKLARLKELQRQQQLLKQQQEEQAQQQALEVEAEEEESYEEEIIEEEIIEDYSENSYEEEEIIEEDQEINKMLAQIAAKQAELDRLQSQY